MADETTRADLSLYGLREFFEDKIENKVDKEIASDGEHYRVLSDRNFSDEYEQKLMKLYTEYENRPLIPIPNKSGFVLTSVTNDKECKWYDMRSEFDKKIKDMKDLIDCEIDLLKSTDEELILDIYNRCTIEETKSLIKNEVAQYLGNPELVETLKKLNIALKEQHNSETIGEYLLTEFENKYDKEDGEYLEVCVKDLQTQLRQIVPYKLPIASYDTLGGVKIGHGLQIDNEGILSVNHSSLLTNEDFNELIEEKVNNKVNIPVASNTVLGGVKVDPTGGLVVDEDGYLKIDEIDTKSPEEWESKLKTKLSNSCIMVGQSTFSDKSTFTEIETDGRNVRHVSITPMSLYYDKNTGELIPLSFFYTVAENKVLVFSNIDYERNDDAPVLFSYMILLEDQEQ